MSRFRNLYVIMSFLNFNSVIISKRRKSTSSIIRLCGKRTIPNLKHVTRFGNWQKDNVISTRKKS